MATRAEQNPELPMFAAVVPLSVHPLTVNIADALTGHPVAGVSAIINPGDIRTATNDAGNFNIQNLSGGAYTMTLRRGAYATSTVRFSVKSGMGVDLVLVMMPLGI